MLIVLVYNIANDNSGHHTWEPYHVCLELWWVCTVKILHYKTNKLCTGGNMALYLVNSFLKLLSIYELHIWRFGEALAHDRIHFYLLLFFCLLLKIPNLMALIEIFTPVQQHSGPLLTTLLPDYLIRHSLTGPFLTCTFFLYCLYLVLAFVFKQSQLMDKSTYIFVTGTSVSQVDLKNK